MMRVARWAVPVVAGLVLTAGAVHAQRKAGGEIETPKDLDSKDKTRLQFLRDGRGAVGESDKRILEAAAQYYVYRLADRAVVAPKPDSKKSIHDYLQEAISHLPDPKKPEKDPTRAQNQRQYAKEFGNRLATNILKVLDKADEPITKVNAAILLARLGENGQEELTDPLCKVIDDAGQLDAVRLYALRGMKNLLEARIGEGFKDDKGEERLIKCVKSLVNFLKGKPSYDPKTATEEEREAFRYVRREAVRALAATRMPELRKRTVVENRPALELLKVVAASGFDPRPSLSERVDAAVGLGRMQTERVNKYQQDYVAYFIGRLVVDLAAQYERDRGGESRFDYRYHAYLLKEGLTALNTETRGKIPFIAEMVKRATTILNNIQNGNPTDYRAFSEWLNQSKPQSTSLFQGAPDTEVKEGAAEPELKTEPAKAPAPAKKAPPAK